MESKPLVSVIIPCYNQAHWLPEAIMSVLDQTFKDYDIIVVNDGSPDNTIEVAQEFPVKLITKINGGLSAARNTGIENARGTYILTLDADDTLDPNFLELTVGQIDNCDVVGTWQQEFGESNELNRFLEAPTFKDFWNGNQVNCCSLYKKSMWEDLGGYDEDMKMGYEDWDFWIRAAYKGYTFNVLPFALFNYRKTAGSMVTKSTLHHSEIQKVIHRKFENISSNI